MWFDSIWLQILLDLVGVTVLVVMIVVVRNTVQDTIIAESKGNNTQVDPSSFGTVVDDRVNPEEIPCEISEVATIALTETNLTIPSESQRELQLPKEIPVTNNPTAEVLLDHLEQNLLSKIDAELANYSL